MEKPTEFDVVDEVSITPPLEKSQRITLTLKYEDGAECVVTQFVQQGQRVRIQTVKFK
jgi:outer membrane lipoprotein SlyB